VIRTAAVGIALAVLTGCGAAHAVTAGTTTTTAEPTTITTEAPTTATTTEPPTTTTTVLTPAQKVLEDCRAVTQAGGTLLNSQPAQLAASLRRAAVDILADPGAVSMVRDAASNYLHPPSYLGSNAQSIEGYTLASTCGIVLLSPGN
jgi:hypothetical protein